MGIIFLLHLILVEYSEQKLSDLGITDVKEAEQNNESIIYPNPCFFLCQVEV